MGNTVFKLALSALFSISVATVALAGNQGTSTGVEDINGGIQINGGSNSTVIDSADTTTGMGGLGSNPNDTSKNVQVDDSCHDNIAGSCRSAGTNPTPTPTPGGDGAGKADRNAAKEKEADDTAQRAAACRSQYQSARQACEAAISSSDSTCDENNSQEMQSVAKAANQSGSNASASAVQASCGTAGNISDNAKSAVTSYRNKCSGAVQSCTSACGQLSSFLQNNSDCYSAIDLNSSSAQSLASQKNASCSANQAKVDQANQSISNYAKTGTASDACQLASLGGQSANSGQAGSTGISAFCTANPAYPGCSGASKADCSDPSQASNTVCICSKDPNNSVCRGTVQTADASADSSIDSSSRLPASKEAGGDLPNLPGIQQAEKPKSSGDAEDAGGRQGSGNPVGDAKVGEGGPSRNTAVAPVEEESEGILAGFFGAGGIGGKIGLLQRAGRPAIAADKAAKTTGGKDQTPDLRQFLPGGFMNPRYNGITGSVRVGVDGITGPHTDIWKKIQNRYQVLQHSLEP